MQDFIIFLADNWQLVLSVFLLCCSLVLNLFIKKRPAAYSTLQYIEEVISNDLPGYIVEAEKTGETGDKKLLYVVNKCIKKLSSYVVLDNEALDKAQRVFAFAIEQILLTPRKK